MVKLGEKQVHIDFAKFVVLNIFKNALILGDIQSTVFAIEADHWPQVMQSPFGTVSFCHLKTFDEALSHLDYISKIGRF